MSRAVATAEHGTIKLIKPGFLLPSAAYVMQRRQVRHYEHTDKRPEVGDLVYGRIVRIGQHVSLENREGRIHMVNDGTKAVFVFGNRYAPDYYEGVVPDHLPREVDLLARSGVVGQMLYKNARVSDPTRVRILGYVCDKEGNILNTRNHSIVRPRKQQKTGRRAKMVLVVGTAMNSGKSQTAVACCWGLSAMGYTVRGSKVTGTASLKDILHMEDAGATPTTDFSFLGYPSTYLLSEEELLNIFNTLDLKYANNPRNFWVVEIADGLLQRETAMLLQSPVVRERIHRLVFCSNDSMGAIGGLKTLRERFNLEPHAISGVCTSSPLGMRELEAECNVPVFANMQPDLKVLSEILL